MAVDSSVLYPRPRRKKIPPVRRSAVMRDPSAMASNEVMLGVICIVVMLMLVRTMVKPVPWSATPPLMIPVMAAFLAIADCFAVPCKGWFPASENGICSGGVGRWKMLEYWL